MDLDPERPGLVQDALAQAGAANRDAGNPILAVLDQVQERLDLARLRLPADARHDKMLDVARQFVEHARGAAASGNWNLVQTFETAADVSLQEAAQPAGARTALTERFLHKGVKHDVTVDPNAADPFGTFKDHSKGQDGVGGIIESLGGAVLNVAAIFQPYLWPAAAALDAAQSGQSFSQGNTLGGLLSLASAAGVGLNGLGQGVNVLGFSAGTLGLTPAQAAAIGGYTLAATAAAGGGAAAEQAAQKGDGLGVAAGLLQVLAAAAAGEGVSQGGGSASLKLGTIGLGVLAGATTLADGADTGGLAGALSDVGALATAIAGAVQQVRTDPSLQAGTDQIIGKVAAGPADMLGGMVRLVGGPPTPPPPDNIPGGPWTWSADSMNKRGGTFVGENNTKASWDETDGHWDVDDKERQRTRYNRFGAPLTPEEAHSPVKGSPRVPLPFRSLFKVLPPLFILPEQEQMILGPKNAT